MIRARRLSPVEVVDAHLAQIERHNPALNAFVMQFPSEARALAIEAERGGLEGPLRGIPLTIKDSFDIRDLPTLCGTRFRLDHRAPTDSVAVARLRAAGAIFLGKTNCPEFLMNYETDNHITGRTNNPWNVDHTAGGSSGGEAAAIAAFCSAGGMGSDGGGSIRVPAHFCGIAGLKPTPGRVPAAGHFPEISHPGGLLGVAGPMARTVEDIRLLFEIVAGYDPADPFSAPVPLRKPELGGLRIGLVESVSGAPVTEECRNAVHKAARLLTGAGFIVEPVSLSDIEQACRLWWFFFGEVSSEFTRETVEGRESDAHWTGVELMKMVTLPAPITGKTMVENLGRRDRLRTSLFASMQKTPVLLTPACGVAAFPHQERGMGLLDVMSQATPFNLFGMPALAVPVDVTPAGLPVGVQLAGMPYSEELLLAVGERLEQARGPFPSPPGY